jgi:hypothetical protein
MFEGFLEAGRQDLGAFFYTSAQNRKSRIGTLEIVKDRQLELLSNFPASTSRLSRDGCSFQLFAGLISTYAVRSL